MCINTSHKALTGRFFVPCGTINLSCKKQITYDFGLQTMPQLCGWKIIVFYSIPWTKCLEMRKTGYITKRLVLNFFGQGSAKAIHVNFNGVPSFRLDKQLMSFFVSETIQF